MQRFGFNEEPEENFKRWFREGLDHYTYFARGKWTGRIKIGRSNDPWRRVHELIRSANGEEAELLTVIRGDFEPLYHRDFAQHHHGHEWFHPAPEILDEIERLKARAA